VSAFLLQTAGVINLAIVFLINNVWATNYSDIRIASHFIAGVILISASAIVYAIQSTETKP
jgi:hypothetical protein